jgi:hypothetical protein
MSKELIIVFVSHCHKLLVLSVRDVLHIVTCMLVYDRC